MSIQQIVSSIVTEKASVGGIDSVIFVACGGSYSTLYPAKYFLDKNAKNLRVGHYTANEFMHATPAYAGRNSVVVTVSHHGNTLETVASAGKAREIGAASITLTFDEGSPLTEFGDHVIVYEWGADSDFGNSNVVLAMKLAVEILQRTEGYAGYEGFLSSCSMVDRVIKTARKNTIAAAEQFAKDYKDEPVIYVLGSGTGFSAAYSFSVCILMEMQWIHSSPIHSGEFFHGPFEITDPKVPFILLKSSGRTRVLDERVLKFLGTYGKKYIILDSTELGLPEIGSEYSEYFDHIFFTAVLRQYAEKLAETRDHPLSLRRYMWKVEY